jgi:hypothetical protein
MDKHYDVYNIKTNEITPFDLLKDAELWVTEQEHPEDFDIIPVEVLECSSPMNLFLSSGTLTRNKK